MKKLTVLLVLIFILLNDLYSQEKTSSKEVGLYFSSLNSFGVRYKFGNEKRMFRLTALSLSAERTTSPDQNKAGAGLNFGVELPFRITDVFSFYYGPELRSSFNHQKIYYTSFDYNSINEYNVGIGMILGFSRSFQSNIIVSVEIVPGFSYNKIVSDNVDTTSFGFGLYSNSAAITIGYRF
ncbi:MAG TPA: hypothetical protein VFC67_07465 [Prolixibacteraceae bacterium]|nr:hypothetical protein [Prolixibacteraceae bacterium]